MISTLRNRFAFFLINLGIKVLPEDSRTRTLISNCMVSGHIKGLKND